LAGAGRQRAVQFRQRARGRHLAGALDRGALQLAAQVLLELPHLLRVEGRLRLSLAVAAPCLEAEASPDSLNVNADHSRALAAPAEGADRETCQVAHLAV